MATATRTIQAIHGATANINGQNGGGLVNATINTGYDGIINASHDGLIFPMPERLIPFVRGNIICQDYEQVLSIFNGTAGNYIFYEKESGLATYIKHTLSTTVIHTFTINLANKQYATVAFDFECQPGAGQDMSDMWVTAWNTAKPAFLASARAIDIVSATHTSVINHVTGITVNMGGEMLQEMTDGAQGYEDIELVNYAISGSITFQDSTTATPPGTDMVSSLMERVKADLVVVVRDSGGSGTSVLTIKNVLFTGGSSNPNAGGQYNSRSVNFIATDNSAVPLTTATAITIV